MADNSSQPGQSGQEIPLTKEQERFRRIRDHIPVHLRPNLVPPPISNLSTAANVELSQLHQIVENDQSLSEKLQAAVFVNALSKVFGPDSAIFVKNTLIRISNDRRYGYVIGRSRFSTLELKGTEKTKLLVFVISTASGGNRVLGVYRSCDVKLLDITPEEPFYRALPDEVKTVFRQGAIPCTPVVFDSFDEQMQAKVRQQTVLSFTASTQAPFKNLATAINGHPPPHLLDCLSSTRSNDPSLFSTAQSRRPNQEELGHEERDHDGVFWESRDQLDQQTWDTEVRPINNSPTKFDQPISSLNHTAQTSNQPTPSNRAISRREPAFPKSGGRDIKGKGRAEEIVDHEEVGETSDGQEGPSRPNVTSKIDFDPSYAVHLAEKELSVDGISQEELEWLVPKNGNTDPVESFDAQRVSLFEKEFDIVLTPRRRRIAESLEQLQSQPVTLSQGNETASSINKYYAPESRNILRSDKGDNSRVTVGENEVGASIAANDPFNTPVTRQKRKWRTPSTGGSDKPRTPKYSRGEGEVDSSPETSSVLNYNSRRKANQVSQKLSKNRRYSDPVLPCLGVQTEPGASQTQNALDGGLRSTAGDRLLRLTSKKAMTGSMVSSNGVMGSYKCPEKDVTSGLRDESTTRSLTSMISATGPESILPVLPRTSNGNRHIHIDSQTPIPTPLPGISTMKTIYPAMQQQSSERQPEPSARRPADPAASATVPESQNHKYQQEVHPRDSGSSQRGGIDYSIGSGPSARTDPSTDPVSIIRGWCTVLLDMDDELLAAAGLRVTRPRTSVRTKDQVFSYEETLLNLLKTSRGVLATVSPETLSTFGIEIISYQPGALITLNRGSAFREFHNPGTSSSRDNLDVPLPRTSSTNESSAHDPVISNHAPGGSSIQHQPEPSAPQQDQNIMSISRPAQQNGLTITLPEVGGSQQPAAGDGVLPSVKALRGGAIKGKKRGSTVGTNSQAPQQESSRPSRLESVPDAPLRDQSSEPMDWAPFSQEPLIDDRGSPIRVDSEEISLSEGAVQGGSDVAVASNVTEEATPDHEGMMELDRDDRTGSAGGSAGGQIAEAPPTSQPPSQGTRSVQPEAPKEQRASGSTATAEAKPPPEASSHKPAEDTAENKAKSKSRSKSKGRANQKKSDVEVTRAPATTSRTTTNGGSQDNPQATTPSQLPQSTSNEENNPPPPLNGSPHLQPPTSDVPGAGVESGGGEPASITHSLDQLSLLQPDRMDWVRALLPALTKFESANDATSMG